MNTPPPGIHPTAIIDPTAQLGSGVQVGPYAVIEGPASVGADCVIHAHAVLTGDVRLGARVRVGYGAVLGGWPQDFSFNPATKSHVEVGDDTQIREGCTIHRGTAEGSCTRLGARCLLMVNVHLGHNSQVADDVVIANSVLLGGYVEIGPRAFIGGGSVFHQHVRVGRGAMVQGISGISKDVPPFSLAAMVNSVWGLNAVGMRRAGMPPETRAEVKRAFQLLYNSRLNVAQAIEAAREQTWGEAAAEFWAFAAASKKRGLCALGSHSKQIDAT